MSVLDSLAAALGFGCEYAVKCGSYQKDSYCCNNSPYKEDGGSYCGIHREIKDGKIRI